MKKLLVSMLVAVLCVPAMASVAVTTDNSVAGQLTVTLTADGVETTELVGVAIEVDSDVDVQSCTIAESFFDVYVDSAFSNVGYTIGSGMPTATQDGPGELALPAASFSVSVAGLDDDGIGEGTEEAPLTCTIVLTFDAEANVMLAVDTLRGGAVSYAGAEEITGMPAEAINVPYASPEVKGNFNGDGFIDGNDVAGFIACFGSSIGTENYNSIGDFNDDGYVDGNDVQGFIDVFGTVVP